MVKRIRAFLLGVLLLLSSCVSFAAPMVQDTIGQECGVRVLSFVHQYLDLREKGATPQELIAALRGRPAAVNSARRFIEAESRGDISEARAALDELFTLCVDDLKHPKVEA